MHPKYYYWKYNFLGNPRKNIKIIFGVNRWLFHLQKKRLELTLAMIFAKNSKYQAENQEPENSRNSL